MFFNNDNQKENRNQFSESKIQEIEVEVNKLEHDVKELYELMGVTAEQLTAYLENKNNFSDEEWNEIHQIKQQLDEKLNRSQNNIRNPLKVKRAYNDLHVRRNWLFVK